MKLIISSVFTMLTVLSSMPSLAQSEIKPISADSSSATPQHILSVVYKSTAVETPPAGTTSPDQISGFGDDTNTSSKLKLFRQDGLSMTNSHSNMFVKDDRASFTVNAPMPEVNGALSLVGTACQTQVDSTVAKWVQVLSLVATRKLNAEVAYSAKINKNSSIDSVIAYRFDSGNSGAVASIKYGIKF
jgi:hypothetical protein